MLKKEFQNNNRNYISTTLHFSLSKVLFNIILEVSSLHWGADHSRGSDIESDRRGRQTENSMRTTRMADYADRKVNFLQSHNRLNLVLILATKSEN